MNDASRCQPDRNEDRDELSQPKIYMMSQQNVFSTTSYPHIQVFGWFDIQKLFLYFTDK